MEKDRLPDGFLPAADGIRLPGARQLVMTSVDLARDAAGNWTVIADRNQAPCGCDTAVRDLRWSALEGLRLDDPTE